MVSRAALGTDCARRVRPLVTLWLCVLPACQLLAGFPDAPGSDAADVDAVADADEDAETDADADEDAETVADADDTDAEVDVDADRDGGEVILVDAHSLHRYGDSLFETVISADRYWTRSGPEPGAMNRWSTATLASIWGATKSNDLVHPHPPPAGIDMYSAYWRDDDLVEVAMKADRYWQRSGPTPSEMSDWWTDTLTSAWGATESTDSLFPHPPLEGIDASSQFRYDGDLHETVFAAGRFWTRSGPGPGEGGMSDWYTDSLENVWGETASDDSAHAHPPLDGIDSYSHYRDGLILIEMVIAAGRYWQRSGSDADSMSDWATGTLDDLWGATVSDDPAHPHP
jgi:hypothetical protein